MKRITLLVLALAFISLYFCSCTKDEPIDQTGNTYENASVPSHDETQKEPITVDYTINYYDMMNDVWNKYTSENTFYGEIDPIFFINKLSELMGISISINGIDMEEDKLTIDFSESSPPLSGIGSYEEICILDSISDTLFEVFSGVNEIYITKDGKEYGSGHLTLAPDTPYATRQSEKLG